MKNLSRMFLVVVVGFLAGGVPLSCKQQSKTPDRTLVLAPPAPPDDLIQGTNLPNPPKDAIVFDLRYRVQRGDPNEISYHSYWGFGSSDQEAKKVPFIQAVQKRTSKLTYVNNNSLNGRQWSALERDGKKIVALYFDLNRDGKLSDNERLLPNKTVGDDGVAFITPDFTTTLDGREVLFRALLEVRFYSGNSEPNCMWSPACLLEGTSSINGKPAQLLLFTSGFSGEFSRYGSCSQAILMGEKAGAKNDYIPRETLSSLVRCESQFYHLKFEGQRASGHPARVVLTRDTDPTGSLDIKLLTAKPVETTFNGLYLQGVYDKSVCFQLENLKGNLPQGTYDVQRGYFSYGPRGQPNYMANFTKGSTVTVETDKKAELVIGEPTLVVRAIKENERYTQNPATATVFKKGTRLYLEPQIVGRSKEVFSGFKTRKTDKNQWVNASPQVTITGPDGKILLTKTMEYG